MVSKASDDLPDPLTPVITISERGGSVTSTFFRLCVRAPRTTICPLVSAMYVENSGGTGTLHGSAAMQSVQPRRGQTVLFCGGVCQSVCSSATCLTARPRQSCESTCPASASPHQSSSPSIERPVVRAASRSWTTPIAPSPRKRFVSSTRLHSKDAVLRSARRGRAKSAVPVGRRGPAASVVHVLAAVRVDTAVRARVLPPAAAALRRGLADSPRALAASAAAPAPRGRVAPRTSDPTRLPSTSASRRGRNATSPRDRSSSVPSPASMTRTRTGARSTRKKTTSTSTTSPPTRNLVMPMKSMMSIRTSSSLLAIAALLTASPLARQAPPPAQPLIEARAKRTISTDNLQFKDLNGSGQLDPYEDWRLPVDDRVRDLVSRMTLDEKAGLMLIDTLNPAAGGAATPQASDYVQREQMRRFIFRSVVTSTPVQNAAGGGGRGGFAGAQVTPGQAATWTNAVQELAEGTRLGIPVVFKSNARNHYERSARLGINTEAGSLSEWPKEAGLAATRDLSLIADFARTMGEEWRAIGLRGMYGYMADLATEPRWYRVHECFTEDADLAADILTTLVKNLQGGPLSPRSAVALTIKHFPGGGPQQFGLDPHFTFGKNQVYPGGQFARHLKPFVAAIDAGASAIMPYYGVPIDLSYGGVTFDRLGMSFSKQIVTDLLRGTLGFKGYVNSDTGIITDRAWGFEQAPVPQRVAAAINSGTDVLSGFHDRQTILEVVRTGLVSEHRIDEAAGRLLREQFLLGLFENPYGDASRADAVVGSAEFRAKAMDAQRASIVLLQNASLNRARVLPLPRSSASRPVKLYTLGLNPRVVSDPQYGGYTIVSGEGDGSSADSRVSAAGSDYALIRVEVTNPRNVTSTYNSADPATGANPSLRNPLNGKTWGADDPGGLDNSLTFGGPFPWEADNLSFTAMAVSKSWNVSPSLATIQAVMKEVGAERTVLCIYFRQPYVLDAESGLTRAGAILAGFGVSDAALMDVITGRFAPRGKLPFALARTLQAVKDSAPDAPAYPAADTLFPFGHGLTYATASPGSGRGRQ